MPHQDPPFDRSPLHATRTRLVRWIDRTSDRDGHGTDPADGERTSQLPGTNAPSDRTSAPGTGFDLPSDPPRSFVDREGHTIAIRFHGEHLERDEFEPLVSLYGAFHPADRIYDLPPSGGDRIRAWLGRLLRGVNVLAWHDDAVAGHATLVETPTGFELMAFVHRAYQHAGIGRRLVATLVEYGRRNGIEEIGLVVDRRHRTAVGLFRRAGFEPVNARGSALEMALAR